MIGSTIPAAKAAIVRIVEACESVDLVVRGNPRNLPGKDVEGAVYLLRTDSVSARDTAGTYVTETFAISMVLDAQFKAHPRSLDMVPDEQQLARAESRKWLMIEEIGEAVARDPFNGAQVTSARVEVTDEITSYVDDWFIGRIAFRVSCETGPVIG